MNTASPIHNLSTLEDEIYRLKQEAAAKEKQLEENFYWVKQNAKNLVMDELFCKTGGHSKEESSDSNNFKTGRWKTFFDHLTDRLADRAADGIENLLDKLFHKKKKHS